MKKIYLVAPRRLGRIAPEVYGHFSEQIGGVFYDGLWVGRDSPVPNLSGFRRELVEKLRQLSPPVLRWPGGCFAETYDWRDGIGDDRPTRPGWWTPNDGRYETNAVGTHEFLELCRLIGAKPYFAANLTSSTPLEIRDWMDYCLSPRGTTTLAREREKNGRAEPFDIPYWGVGNENWGGGGNMRPEFYADECRRYATVMKNTAPSARLIVCGSNADDCGWTQKVMESLASQKTYLDGFAMHYYCGTSGDAVNFGEEDWYALLARAGRMEEILRRNWNIISGFQAQDRIKLVVDEWGCWHREGSGPSRGRNLFEQQSTMRDALVAALTLNIFNNNCEKIAMANVAQLVNNLHALFLAGGGHCIVTPTYRVFELYRQHQGAEAIETVVTENSVFEDSLSVSASVRDHQMLVTVGNLSCGKAARFTLERVGFDFAPRGKAVLLGGGDMHAHNTFEAPDAVGTAVSDFDPAEPVTIPAASVLALHIPIREAGEKGLL